jgi:tRNA(fMet)-specific endonuclease VapC
MKYLLDTNIIIFWLKGRYGIADQINKIGVSNCFVSEITIAELRYSVLNEEKKYIGLQPLVEDDVFSTAIIPGLVIDMKEVFLD